MTTVSTGNAVWTVPKRIALRFGFIFTVLYIFLLDWYAIGFSKLLFLYTPIEQGLITVIQALGRQVFGISYTIVSPTPGNHSDSTYVYLLYAFMLVVALIGSLMWYWFDRKRTNNAMLYYWFTVVIRYYVAFVMFAFALEKFFKMQFMDLGLYQLSEPLGDMSPMGLAWAFYGYSYGYNIFMGIAECMALLLLFRRTVTLGALLTMAALANVIAVNFSFDIHAKMYPLVLFLLTTVLILPNVKRIAIFFLGRQPVALEPVQVPVYDKRWKRITKWVVMWGVIGFHLISELVVYAGIHSRTANRAIPEYHGLYDVETYVLGGDTLRYDHPERWREIVFDRHFNAVRFTGDSIAFTWVDQDPLQLWPYGTRADIGAHVQELFNEFGSYDAIDSLFIARKICQPIQFELIDPQTLVLSGMLADDSVSITAKRRPVRRDDYRLIRSRFNWITEAPNVY
jgi:hypothetical protein